MLEWIRFIVFAWLYTHLFIRRFLYFIASIYSKCAALRLYKYLKLDEKQLTVSGGIISYLELKVSIILMNRINAPNLCIYQMLNGINVSNSGRRFKFLFCDGINVSNFFLRWNIYFNRRDFKHTHVIFFTKTVSDSVTVTTFFFCNGCSCSTKSKTKWKDEI